MKQHIENEIWVLVYTKPRQEKIANENLQKQGFETFLPLISADNKNEEDQTSVPIFPRYIFVKINLTSQNWTLINSSYGVSKIIMFGDNLTPVPIEIISFIKDKLNSGIVYEESILLSEYKKGDWLTIKEGKFAGIEAIFLSKKSKDRVRLLLKLLNTTVISEISNSDLGSKEVVKKFKF